MSITRFGRQETGEFQRRHLQVRHKTRRRSGRTVAGTGTGRTTGTATGAEVIDRAEWTREGTTRICWILRIGGVGPLPRQTVRVGH